MVLFICRSIRQFRVRLLARIANNRADFLCINRAHTKSFQISRRKKNKNKAKSSMLIRVPSAVSK